MFFGVLKLMASTLGLAANDFSSNVFWLQIERLFPLLAVVAVLAKGYIIENGDYLALATQKSVAIANLLMCTAQVDQEIIDRYDIDMCDSSPQYPGRSVPGEHKGVCYTRRFQEVFTPGSNYVNRGESSF
jgi:hypothetical protein